MSIVVCVSICFCYPDILRKVKCSSLADCVLGGLESIKNEEEDKIIKKAALSGACPRYLFVEHHVLFLACFHVFITYHIVF